MDNPTKQTNPATDHGAAEVYMDNIGEGWRLECLCGWASTPNVRMQDAGEEFDDHLQEHNCHPSRRSA